MKIKYTYYNEGIPENITKCENCGNDLDIKNKKRHHIPLCHKCRMEVISETFEGN